NYLADGGDDDDEPSDNDDDDTDDEEPFKDKDDDEEEAWKTIRLDPPMSPSMEARIAEYVAAPALPSSPPSPLSPWSPPLSQIPLPPLPPPPSSLHLPPPILASLPLPSSPLPPSLFIPPVDRREDIPKDELPPLKRLCSIAPTSRYEVGESSNAAPRLTGGHRVDYGFIGTLDTETRRQRAEAEQDTQDIYTVIVDTQDRQTWIFQSVEALVDDRQYHYETARLLDQEADREAHYAGLPYHLTGVTDDDIDCTDDPEGAANTAVGLVFSFLVSDNHCDVILLYICCTHVMAVAAAARAAAATPMTADVVEQLIEARVSAALANHETLRNSTNGHGDERHNSETGIRGTVRTP
ncbi:hypothetical protein Tco_1496694, partial [Tanacetum coccineum]